MLCRSLSARLAFALGEPFFWLLGLRHKRSEIGLSQLKRVLVVRLDEIGDVVLTTPFLRELRRNLPNAWITLVVKASIYNLVEICPYVNEVLTYDWITPRLLRLFQRHWRAVKLSRRHLWHRRFDLAILPRWDTDYYHGAFVGYFSGAPSRVGYSENVNASKKRLNQGLDRLFTHVLEDSALEHEVEHNLDVVRSLGGEIRDDRLELWLDEEDETFADEVLKNHGFRPGDLLIGLGPGAGAPKRQWPLSCYKELGVWLQNQYAARLVIIGGPGEELLGSELKKQLGRYCMDLVGKTTLRQATAILKRTSVFVGSDAGPMHMAAAVGLPVVELSCHPKSGFPYSANSPRRFRPWCRNHKIVQPELPLPECTEECNADRPHCILSITVDQVKQVVSQLLDGRGVIQGRHVGFGQDLGVEKVSNRTGEEKG